MKGFASLVAVGSACFVLHGCVVVQGSGEPPNPPPPSAAPGKAQTVARPHADGRPNNLASGGPAAYWIWHAGGGHWHIRTTTPGTQHAFYGRVMGHDGAKITGAKALRTETGDKVRYNVKDGITFDFNTAGGVDGIEFTVQGTCVDFALRIDGAQHPQHIVVGAQEQRPKSANFTACP